MKSIELVEFELAIKFAKSSNEAGLILIEALFSLPFEEGNELMKTEEVKLLFHEWGE